MFSNKSTYILDQYWILYVFHGIRETYYNQYYIPEISKFKIEKDYLCQQAWKCHPWHVNVYFTDQNIMQKEYPMELNFESLEMQKLNISIDIVQRVNGKNGVICLVIMFDPSVTITKMSQMAHFCIFYWWQQNISHSLCKIFKCTWTILLNCSRKKAWLIDLGVTALEVLRVEISAKLLSQQKYWNSIFWRVDILLMVVRSQ